MHNAKSSLSIRSARMRALFNSESEHLNIRSSGLRFIDPVIVRVKSPQSRKLRAVAMNYGNAGEEGERR